MAEKKIGSRTFKTEDLLATEAIKLQARIMRFVGPAVEKLPVIFAGRGTKASDDQRVASDAAAVKAISDIFANAEPDAVAQLVADVCEMAHVSYDGRNYDRIVFDQEFSGGNLKDVIPVVTFVLREALGDFFSAALANGNRGAKAAGSPKAT